MPGLRGARASPSRFTTALHDRTAEEIGYVASVLERALGEMS